MTINIDANRYNWYKDKNDKVIIFDKVSNSIVNSFYTFELGFIHQFDYNGRMQFLVSQKFPQYDPNKFIVRIYDMGSGSEGNPNWEISPNFEEAYLGYNCFRLKDNSILSLDNYKQYETYGPFDKIIRDPEDKNSELVLVTKNIINVDAGLVEEMSFLFNLKTEKIEGIIKTKHQPYDIDLMSKQQADKFNELYHIPKEEHYHIKDINISLISDYVGTATLRFGVVKPFESLCESRINQEDVVSESNKELFSKMKYFRLQQKEN